MGLHISFPLLPTKLGNSSPTGPSLLLFYTAESKALSHDWVFLLLGIPDGRNRLKKEKERLNNMLVINHFIGNFTIPQTNCVAFIACYSVLSVPAQS